MQRAYRSSTRSLSVLLFIVGLAMVASALARGGGPLSVGVVTGTLFAVLGAARLALSGMRRKRA